MASDGGARAPAAERRARPSFDDATRARSRSSRERGRGKTLDANPRRERRGARSVGVVRAIFIGEKFAGATWDERGMRR